MYVIQHRKYHWKNEWDTFPGRYQSLVEAKEAFEKLHPLTKPSARIAEEYTVTRYKAVR